MYKKIRAIAGWLPHLVCPLLKHTADRLRTVHGVDVTVQAEEPLGFVGESSCGKSILGEPTLGLSQPTTGTVCFQGQVSSVSTTAARRVRHALPDVYQEPGTSLTSGRQ